MRLKMKVTESGRYPDFFKDTGQFHCLVGHEYDVPDALAVEWVRQGLAEEVKAKKAAAKSIPPNVDVTNAD